MRIVQLLEWRSRWRSCAFITGAGAAGGLGAGLLGFVGAVLKPGADLVMELVGLDRALEGRGSRADR
jgi:glycerate kinase